MRRWLIVVTLLVAFTAPLLQAADSPQVLQRIAFGSCAHQDRPQPIWDAIVATKPNLFLFVGDNIYADTEDMEVMRQKYAKLAVMPGYQKLLKTCPVLATWDDHDYGANDAGVEYPKKVESQQILLDFFGVPKNAPSRKREGIYDAHTFGSSGKRTQVILLDTRYFRSPLKKRAGRFPGQGPYEANNDPSTTMLGETQWKWLEDQLKQPADLRLIVSSIQVVPEDHAWEKWMNMPHERERLFKLIRDTKAAGIIFLSGDRHLAELSMTDGNVGYPLYDLTSSGLNQAFKNWRRQEVNRNRVATMNFGDNFGLITIDWERPDPRISLQIRDLEGDTTIQQKLTLGLLQPTGKVKAVAGGGLAAEAAKYVGKEYTVEMRVAATGQSKTQKLIFLNSETDFRDAANFTVVIDAKAAAKLRDLKVTDPATHFRGKTIRVTGMVSLFENRPQIMVSDPKQIEIIDKK
jgi:alkaline phosphatase D